MNLVSTDSRQAMSTEARNDYSDQDRDILDYCQAEFNTLKESAPNALFYIARSKNKNMVVYEVNLRDGAVVADDPVLVYWMDVDPEYRAKNRKNGVTSDRSDLNFMEKSMAYGVSGSKNATTDGSETYNVKMVAIPDTTFTMKKNSDGQYVVVAEIDGVECVVTRVYVKSQERTFLPPKCIYVDLTGVDASGVVHTKRITP